MLWRTLCLLALAAGGAAGQERLVLASGEDPAVWTAGARDTEHVRAAKASLRWEHGRDAAVALRAVPADWSAYDRLSFWLWSAKATRSRFMVIIGSENPATEGRDYYAAAVALDFVGWRRCSYYLPTMNPSREPRGWRHIDSLTFTASGWGNEPHAEAVVCLEEVVLTKEGQPVGPRLSEDELFAALDLERPELRAVKEALARNDRPAAGHALCAHFRERTSPLWYFPPGQQAEPRAAKPDTARADRALRHVFDSIGIGHEFGPVIDWHFDKTAEGGRAPNNEWTWQLNRHNEWVALSRAWRDTGDEQYAREFVAQMTAWARDCPRPDDAGNVARSAWRTIETGIRASGPWPELWYRFVRSPALTDDALLVFLRAFIDHAHHLMAHHTSGNWLAMEGNGLYHVGALFPEFRDAPRWRETAAGWLHAEQTIQVYPDGVQFELASGYHHVTLSNFLGVFKLARLNNLPLPADYLARLERMYDFYVYGALPDRKLPGVQDGGYMDVRPLLREGATLFPARRDFQWYATDGQEGAAPTAVSYAFPYAGYFFQRSGWEPDARCLVFDGGPFGYGHQHEDKLQIIVHAYGKLLLVDPGVYTYERSKWREYFLDSFSHNVVLVDGQPQRRRGKPRDTYVVKQPLPHVWRTSPQADYVEATYDEDFGGPVKQGVRHTRAVLFVKPDCWVVLDTLEARDGREHSYDALFHFDAPVKADGPRVVTQNADAANLTVAARPDPGVALRVIEGQENPAQGWLTKGTSAVRPAPVGIFSRRGRTVHTLYALVPSPKRAPDPLAAVEPVGDDPMAARLTLRDGRAWTVRFRPGQDVPYELR